MGLGLVLQAVLITRTHSSYSEQCLHRVKVSPASRTTPAVRRLGCITSWEGTRLGQLTPTVQGDIPEHTSQHIKLGKEEGRRYYDFCLPKSLRFVMAPCFPGDGGTTACPWEGVNESLVCFDCWAIIFIKFSWFIFPNRLPVWLALYLLNYLYFNSWVYSLFQFFPHHTVGGVSKQLCDADLLAGIKPWHQCLL